MICILQKKKNTRKITDKKNKTNTMSYSKEELKKRLTPLQYNVTQEAGTERPFTGKRHALFCFLQIFLNLREII